MADKLTKYEWLLIIAIGAVLVAVCMCGCGSTTQRESSTVEREDLVAGPMVVETPVGQFVMHPTKVTRFRTEDTRENAEKSYQFPEVREVGGTMLGGLGGPLAGGGFVGLISAGLMLLNKRRTDSEKAELDRQRAEIERQRNEVIAGVEAAKSGLTKEAWDHLTTELEKKQNDDTKMVVKTRTSK